MRLRTKHWAIACISLVTISGVGAALAQEQGGAANPGPREVSGGQDVNLTPQQMLERARSQVPAMERMRGVVGEQLAEARKKKDVVKALCLDDKVKQMRLASDTAKDRVVDLNAAVTLNESDRAKHEFTVIQVLRERVQTLVSEAQQCIGEETGFIGDSNVVVEIDPAIPDTDPSEVPEDPLVSEPPVLSSPTL